MIKTSYADFPINQGNQPSCRRRRVKMGPFRGTLSLFFCFCLWQFCSPFFGLFLLKFRLFLYEVPYVKTLWF
jgi:hypothetical protein